MYIDTRLTVNQDAAVAIDEKNGDVATADITDVTRDALQTHETLRDSDDLAVVDDRHGDHDGGLIQRGEILKGAGTDLTSHRRETDKIHLLDDCCIESGKLGLGAFSGSIHNSEGNQIALRRNV